MILQQRGKKDPDPCRRRTGWICSNFRSCSVYSTESSRRSNSGCRKCNIESWRDSNTDTVSYTGRCNAQGLVWSSSDEEIATVDENGVVTALKEGTATIKVSNVAGLEATCKVTVKGKAEQPDVDKEAPTAPGKLSKAEVTKDSIQIRWKKSKDNVGVEGYEIFLNGVSIKKVSADTTSVMISNLLAGTEYQITVKAYDAAGNYSEAAALTVKTLAEDKNNSGNKDDNQKPDSGNKNDGQKPSGDQNQNSSADKKPAGVPQVTVVKTGDSGAPIGIFVVLAIVAAGAVVVVVLRMKADQKKNAKKKLETAPDGTR